MRQGFLVRRLISFSFILVGLSVLYPSSALAQNVQGQNSVSSELIDLLTERSARRAVEICRDEAKNRGLKVRSTLDVTPGGDGFHVGLRVRRDGKNRRIECEYDLRKDQAMLVAAADPSPSSVAYRSKTKDLPIVHAIDFCLDHANELALKIDGVSAASIEGNQTTVTFGVDRQSGKAYQCVANKNRKTAQLFVHDGGRWTSLDRKQASDARSARAEKGCISALQKSGASHRATNSIERRGKHIIISLRGRKNGNGFNATCRFNLNTGFTAISTP